MKRKAENREPVKRAPLHDSVRRWTLLFLGTLATFALVLEFGFHLDERTTEALEILDIAIAVVFGLELTIDLALTGGRASRLRWFEYSLAALFALAVISLEWIVSEDAIEALLSTLHLPAVSQLYLILAQIFVLIGAGTHFLREHERMLTAPVRAELMFVGGFAALIALGTALLSLPRSMADGVASLGPVDALFTSTSAVCVTGLAVRDTGSEFSFLGQTILLVLIQVGGLGIITFVGFLVMTSGQSSIPQLVALRKLVNARSVADVGRQILAILLTAVVIEAIGAVALFFLVDRPMGGRLEHGFWALFHSISAFCNAGFALQSDSLTSMRSDWGVCSVIMGLIVIGGLGAPVVRNVVDVLWSRLPRRGPRIARARVRLGVQSRITLVLTGLLIVLGALLFGALESSGGVLAGQDLGSGTLMSLFQSTTTRTAGFNTVEIGDLKDATLIVMSGLMVVGASPVSTGGGIKTVAFGILLLTIRSMMTGKRAEIFGRQIPDRFVTAAISIFVVYVFSAIGICFLLSITDPDIGFVDRVVETVSALSTVGLSTGITSELSSAGKLILCVAMFAGRIGPLSLAMTVVRAHGHRATYDLPEEPLVLS
ncbi:MAG TPA: hypothetical protein ENJ09_15140 [Planctomycetes bacterium]|nr:hypothetical protein [Planctomycetota bacterium]